MNYDFNDLSFNYLNNQIVAKENGYAENINENYIYSVIDKLSENEYDTKAYVRPADNVQNLPDYCFIGNSQLTTVDINKVSHIGIGTFELCQNLVSVTKSGVAPIQLSYSSFAHCTQLQQLPMCNNAPDRCFYNCSSLSTVDFTNNVKYIGNYAFQNCTSLKYILLNNNITSIGVSAFENTFNLHTIQLPEGLIYIEAMAFKNSGLENIRIPANVKFIEIDAFVGNINLKRVTFECSETQEIMFNDNVFRGCPNMQIINKNNNIYVESFAKNCGLTILS
jgi:hypothetical protein